MKLEALRTLNLPTGVLGLAVSRDAARLFVACMDGGIYEVAADSGKRLRFDGVHASYASGCLLLPDEQTLISAGYDGRLLWHEVATRRVVRSVVAHDFWSWRLALSADGRRVASVSGQYLAGGEKYEPAAGTAPTVKVFDAATGERIHSWTQTPPVQSVAFSPDGQFLAAGNLMGEVCVWDLSTGRPVAEFRTPDFTSWGIIKSPHYVGGIYGLKFSPDGSTLLLCGMGPMTDPMAGNGKMTWQRWAWREKPGRMSDQIHDGEHGSGLMESVDFSPDGSAFAMAGRQAQGTWNAAVFSAAEGKLLASTDTKSRITQVGFAATGGTLFLAGAISQPARKDGKWLDYGRIHVIGVQS